MDPKGLLKEALLLPSDARAALAGELIESLDERVDDDAEEAWALEVRQRVDQLDSGRARTVPLGEARRRIHRAAGRDPNA